MWEKCASRRRKQVQEGAFSKQIIKGKQSPSALRLVCCAYEEQGREWEAGRKATQILKTQNRLGFWAHDTSTRFLPSPPEKQQTQPLECRLFIYFFASLYYWSLLKQNHFVSRNTPLLNTQTNAFRNRGRERERYKVWEEERQRWKAKRGHEKPVLSDDDVFAMMFNESPILCQVCWRFFNHLFI